MEILTRRCLNCSSAFEAEVASGCYHIHLLDARLAWASAEVHCTELICPKCHSARSENIYLDDVEEE